MECASFSRCVICGWIPVHEESALASVADWLLLVDSADVRSDRVGKFQSTRRAEVALVDEVDISPGLHKWGPEKVGLELASGKGEVVVHEPHQPFRVLGDDVGHRRRLG